MFLTGDGGSSEDEESAVDLDAHDSIDRESSHAHTDLQPSNPPCSSPQEAEARGFLDVHADDDEEYAEEERDTRFIGAPSTWRFYTENERALAASLDQIRANDLSIHLYNTHAVKARVRLGYSASLQPTHDILEPQNNIRAGDHGKQWQPDHAWTAWPLKPELVPRPGENFGSYLDLAVVNDTYRMAVSWRPREDLENEVQALMLRKVKSNSRPTHHRRSTTALTMKVEDDCAPGSTADVPSRQFHDRTTGSARTFKNSEFKSTFAHNVISGDDIEDKYVIDDDNAAEILQPTASNILDKLDLLLHSLHRSRQMGKTRIPQRTARRVRSQIISGSQATPTPSSSQQSKREDTAVITNTDTSDSGTSCTEMRRFRKPRRRRPLRPRDWQEVLKIATLIGWDEEVLHRTTTRCAELFGNDCRSNLVHLPVGLDTTITEHSTRASASTSQNPGTFTSKSTLIYCPLQDCSRRAIPYEKPWRWREHMKRTHKYTKEQIQQLESQIRTDSQTASETSSSRVSAAAGSDSTSSESSGE